MGINIFDFWKLTPAEYYVHIRAYNKKKFESFNRDITQAYYIALFSRAKKLDKLENYLLNDQEKEIQTKDQREAEKQKIENIFEE